MIKTKSKILKLGAILMVLPLLGLGCKGGGQIKPESLKPITLNWWRVFDSPGDFSEIIAAFTAQHPNIAINVQKVRLEDYEQALLRALAEGNGPDIISLHNTSLAQYQQLITPLPEAITLPVAVPDGKKIKIVPQTLPSLTLRELRNNFVDAVPADAVIGNKIYGLPLALDTLILYYNRALLNQANLANPPASWAEFKEAIKALTKLNRDGEVVQSGAALGGSRNINRAPDILAVLMMQNGTEMTDASGRMAAFNTAPAGLADKGMRPGQDALRFYTDFANPTKEVYTWNEKMPESLNAFTSQKTALFFGYAYHLPLIRSLAPNLDLGIAKLPQIATDGKPVNFANYWLEGVTKQSKYQSEAWAFIQFAAAAGQVKSFLKRANKPAALRGLISEQRQSDDLLNFADQVLTARSWYRGKNAAAAEEALRVMIEQVAGGKAKPEEAINLAAQKINETF